MNYLKKTLTILIISAFSVLYVGCDQNNCSVCEGDGSNVCVMCENKKYSSNCIYCENTKESKCTYCNGTGIELKK